MTATPQPQAAGRDAVTSDTAPAQFKDVLYTFGNHFHWVDMQWLWGYDTLSRSVRDMLDFIAATGARGNINFDVVGYERMAAEQPVALAELRSAVHAGLVEPVGCTYGQPYALFHGAESALRQLVYGARGVVRLLGVRPRTFWEEEFFFFPQLPQMLAQCGFSYASLFLQWTWHTPHVPMEEAPAIWWEGVDGTRILTAPRTRLNLHQWPEDFDAMIRDPLLAASPAPIIQQWLELLPSPDWMCRSELLVPGVKQLAAIVEPRPWWAPFIRISTRLARYQLPVGATAILALTFITVREYRLPSVDEGLSPSVVETKIDTLPGPAVRALSR